MNRYLFHPDEYEFLYNCSMYDPAEIPIEQRRKPLAGIFFLVMTFGFEILYIPCLVVLFKKQNFRKPSFKIMAYLAMVNSAGMMGTGFMTGIFAMEGAIFCTHPTVIYIGGAIGGALWFAETTTSVILAINRCLVMYKPSLTDALFDGRKTYMWLSVPTIYFFAMCWFLHPLTFSGVSTGYFFNPHIYYRDDFDVHFSSRYLNFHNCTFVTLLLSIYATFFVLLRRRGVSTDEKRLKKEMSSFVQIFIISALNLTTAIGYMAMEMYRVPMPFVIFTTAANVMTQGAPVFIYVFMNKTVSDGIRAMLGRRSTKVQTTVSATRSHMDGRKS